MNKKLIVFAICLLIFFRYNNKQTIDNNVVLDIFEAQTIGSLFAYVPVETGGGDDEVDDACDCDKNTGKISYDGGTSLTDCPCPINGKSCGCPRKSGDIVAPPTETVSRETVHYNDYYIIKFTASWCGPCQQWERNEKNKVTSTGIQVVPISDSKKMQKSGVSSMPTFWICTKKDQKAYTSFKFTGYRSADFLIKEIEKLDNSLRGESVSSSGSGKATPRYVRVRNPSNRAWNEIGVAHTKNNIINHLRTVHRLNNWPLKDFDLRTLDLIHSDAHNKQLGAVKWSR